MAGRPTHQLCLGLPENLEKEEIVILSKQGNVFDESQVKESVCLGFGSSRRVREDATVLIRRAISNFTGQKINIITYEQARLDNSVLWERPKTWIELQVRGLVFLIWSDRELRDGEQEGTNGEGDIYDDASA